MSQTESLLEKVERLQDILVDRITACAASDDGVDELGQAAAYRHLRLELVSDPWLLERLPSFVRDCRRFEQFDHWIWTKGRHMSADDARAYIWDAFRPLLAELEWPAATPIDDAIDSILERFDSEHVQIIWRKMLNRRESDLEGAITLARTLLEAVCKRILDERGVQYGSKDDLPRLYRRTAEELRLAPNQYPEEVFRQILGGCKSVVEGLGALRNGMGDAHGYGTRRVRPARRHAELAVNLAGTVAMFLVDTWTAREAEVIYTDIPTAAPLSTVP